MLYAVTILYKGVMPKNSSQENIIANKITAMFNKFNML